jgi:arginyl-tRNA synthetase
MVDIQNIGSINIYILETEHSNQEILHYSTAGIHFKLKELLTLNFVTLPFVQNIHTRVQQINKNIIIWFCSVF